MTALEYVPKLSPQLGGSQKGVEPYIGPRAFRRTAEDQERFFGRDDEADEIVSLISAHKLVLVYAQSGAGKTSLFNAQVIPALERRGFEVLPVARVQVTDSSSSTTAFSQKNDGNFFSSLPQIENVYIFNAIQSLNQPIEDPKLLADKSLTEFLSDYFPNQIDDDGEVVPQVLIFDQLEELFNFSTKKWKEQQEAFFKQISKALNNNSSLRIALVIREDHLAELDPFQSLLLEKLRPRFRLERLRAEAAVLAIKGPLEKTTQIFNDRSELEGEIRKLVKNLTTIQIEDRSGGADQAEGEFVEPIHLQIVCQKWWREQLSSSSSSTFNALARQDTLRSFGDVDKALEEFYENAVHDVVQHTNITEKEIREWCECQLITSSQTRGIVHQSGHYTAGMANNVVEILDKKFYLIRPEPRSGGVWYELTHDRLVKPIIDSNKKWRKEREKETEEAFTELWQIAVAERVRTTSSSLYVLLHGPSKFQSENVDQVLTTFYETVIKKSLKKTGIEEGELRTWCERTLITTGRTRAVVHKDNGSVGGIPNKVADVLQEECLIRKEERSGDQWYQLYHEKLIKPIIDSNEKWYEQIGKSGKRNQKLKIVLPTAIIGVVLLAFYLSMPHPVTLPPHCSVVPLEGLPSAIDSNIYTNKTYVATPDSNKLDIFDHNTCMHARVPVGKNPLGVAVDPNLNKVYVANNNSNTISIIDGRSNELVPGPVKVGRGPDAVAVDLNTSNVYVANSKDNTVSVIDPKAYAVGKIPVGRGPTAVAVDPNTNKVFVANHDDDTVSVIDPKTNTVVGNIPVGRGPAFVAIDPKMQNVYVASNDSSSVSVIDTKTNGIASNPIPVGSGLKGLAVNTNTHTVYVSTLYPNSIYIIDGKNRPFTVINNVRLNDTAGLISFNPYTNQIYHMSNSGNRLTILDASTVNKNKRDIITVGRGPLDVKFDQKTNKIYVVNLGDSTVSLIDPKTNKVVGSIKVGTLPDSIAIDKNTNKAYVANNHDDTVSVIDLNTNTIVGKPIPVRSGPYAVAVDTNTNKAYVTNHDDDTVSVIDLNTNTVVGKPIPVGGEPYAVAVDTNTNKAYVANSRTGSISVIDGRTNTVVGKPIPVGGGPEAVAVDPNTNKAYTVNYVDDTVSVIDLNTNTVVGKPIPVGGAPGSIAIDPTTHKAYVTNSKSSTVDIIDLKTNAFIGKLNPIGTEPRAVALDPNTNKAYVANFKDNTVSVTNSHPWIKRG